MSNKASNYDVDDDIYFDLANKWDTDNFEKMKKSRNRAWIVTFLSWAVTALTIYGITLLIPLYKVEPYLLRFNDTTGTVEQITSLSDKINISSNEALTQAYLYRYIISRETIDPLDFNERSQYLSRFSEASIFDAYSQYMSRNNASSPYNNLLPGERVEVEVTSISMLASDYASIRYKTQRKKPNGLPEGGSDRFIAYVRFDYVDSKTFSTLQRWYNPLGFIATSIRKDREIN